MDEILLNDRPKATLIETFTGKILILMGGAKHDCKDIKEAKEFVEQCGWQIGISHVHGSSILRNRN